MTNYESLNKNEEKIFLFWMEFFIEATKEHFTNTQFPVSCLVIAYPLHSGADNLKCLIMLNLANVTHAIKLTV